MGTVRRKVFFKRETKQQPEQSPAPVLVRKVHIKPVPAKPKKPADPEAPLSATAVTSKRKAAKAIADIPEIQTADDYIGSYIRDLPEEPIAYMDLVTQFILPQTHKPMYVFGKELRITPSYVPTLCGKVKVLGILCEVDVGTRGIKNFKIKRRIEGNKSLWYSKIKYLVKLAME